MEETVESLKVKAYDLLKERGELINKVEALGKQIAEIQAKIDEMEAE